MLALGLISGTSADGIDAALVDFSERPRLLAAATTPYDDGLRERLLGLAQDPQAAVSPDEFGSLHAEVGEAFAAAAQALLDSAGVAREAVAAIGSHGQTIRHRPQASPPYSMQLGDAARIVERTGITTVADFRARDIAAGGQGAPLMPAFHQALFADPGEPRAVLNLGGIANLSLLEPGQATRGFDTGPANALVDAWCARHHGRAFDRDGALAAAGRVDEALLARLLDDPWFALPPPKSTGREHFHLDWLAPRLGEGFDPADVPATLLELSVRTVADALDRAFPQARRVLACGGGARNPELMARLARRLAPRVVESTQAQGFDPEFIEAAGFAWLAREALAGRAVDLGAITGARGPRVLGAVHRA